MPAEARAAWPKDCLPVVRDQLLPADDPRQRQPDIALARKMLDWQPTVALADGLRETIAYFRGLI